ncbi:MAG: hypothetical protein EBY20_03540, partial [Alphaproteobacteria bacterium]|nr:hypothetical protein [Alphaproteobacteria bacterium]
PSLGKLTGLSELMQEGRKYGICVLAGIQSTSQLYHHYGDRRCFQSNWFI